MEPINMTSKKGLLSTSVSLHKIYFLELSSDMDIVDAAICENEECVLKHKFAYFWGGKPQASIKCTSLEGNGT